MTFIATRALRRVDALSVTAEDIDLETIAHSLAQINRFVGQLDVPYSVAQHSVWVSAKMEILGGSLNSQRAGLVHDGSESFLSDIPSPYKKLLESYQKLEKIFQTRVYEAFGVDVNKDVYKLLKYCDTLAGLTEARDLHPYDFNTLDWVQNEGWDVLVEKEELIVPLDWVSAKNLFLHRAAELELTHI